MCLLMRDFNTTWNITKYLREYILVVNLQTLLVTASDNIRWQIYEVKKVSDKIEALTNKMLIQLQHLRVFLGICMP